MGGINMWGLLILFYARVCTVYSKDPGGLMANRETFKSLRSETFTYYFYEAEPVFIRCYKTGHGGGGAVLTYLTKGQELLSTEFNYQATTMSMKLTAATNNDTTLKCSIKVEENPSTTINYNIFLKLIVKHDDKPTHGFVVNGMIIVYHAHTLSDDMYYYNYRYYSEEPLTVEVLKSEKLYQDVTCKVDKPRGDNFMIVPAVNMTFKPDIVTGGSLFYSLRLLEEHSYISLRCILRRKTNENPKNFTMSLSFTYNTPEHSPDIIGLSKAKIATEFTDAHAYRYKYEYSEDETLHLSCLRNEEFQSNDNNFVTWSYQPTEVTTSSEGFLKPRSFQLRPKLNYSSINCSIGDALSRKTVFVELIRKTTTIDGNLDIAAIRTTEKVLAYLKSQLSRIEKSDAAQRSSDQLYLYSLLQDMDKMNDAQRRIFKKYVSLLIGEILKSSTCLCSSNQVVKDKISRLINNMKYK